MLTLKKYSLPKDVYDFYRDEENSHLIKEALEKGHSIVTSDVYKYNSANLQTDVVTELKDELYSVKKDKDNLQNKLTELSNIKKFICNGINNTVNTKFEDKDKLIKSLEDNLNDKKNELKQEKDEKINIIRERDAAKNELNKFQNTLSNPAKKGKYGEDMIREILENNEQFNELFYLNNEGKTAYSCDFHIIPRKYGNTQYAPRFLLEVKFYNESNSNKLVQNEIPKMKRDINEIIKKKIPIIASLFISIGCEIPNKKGISSEIYNNTIIVYISNFGETNLPEFLLVTMKAYIRYYESYNNKSTNNPGYLIIINDFINTYNNRVRPKKDYFTKSLKAAEETVKTVKKSQKCYEIDQQEVINEFDSKIEHFENLSNNEQSDNDIENIRKMDVSKLQLHEVYEQFYLIRATCNKNYTEKEFWKNRCEKFEEKEKVVEKNENSVMLKVENIHEEILEEENTQEEVLENPLQCKYCSQIYKSKSGLTNHKKKCNKKNNENTSTEN